jgi:hypothetical protein
LAVAVVSLAFLEVSDALFFASPGWLQLEKSIADDKTMAAEKIIFFNFIFIILQVSRGAAK